MPSGGRFGNPPKPNPIKRKESLGHIAAKPVSIEKMENKGGYSKIKLPAKKPGRFPHQGEGRAKTPLKKIKRY